MRAFCSHVGDNAVVVGRSVVTDSAVIGGDAHIAGRASLKEPLESRASWQVFLDHLADWLRTLHVEARRSLFLAVRIRLGNRFWDLIVTVMFFGVLRAVLFTCGGTPIHPFVNPPACSGSRSGRLGPDTEYSSATVSRTQAVSIKKTLGNRAESIDLLRLALRPRGPLLHQEGGPMQPSLPSLQFLLLFEYALSFLFPRGRLLGASSRLYHRSIHGTSTPACWHKSTAAS